LIAVAGPAREVADAVARFDRLLVLSLGGLAVALAAAVLLQVTYGLRPLQRLARDLDDVRAGRSARLATDQPAEIGPLAVAMNDVLDHDARLVERARTHAGNLAHGLKTPLSVLALESSHGAVPDASRVAEQVATMSRLVEHHLARAAAAGTRRVLGARCPLAPVVDELRATLLRLHGARDVALDVALAPAATFAGERADLEEMLGNLLDNACKWAASRVTLRAEQTGGLLRIAVEDDGPGVAADDAAIALRRGGRLDEATPGSGLGLAIVGELAELYDGSLALAPGTRGGLSAVLTLPAA
jgi:signal transduction histidine kinase